MVCRPHSLIGIPSGGTGVLAGGLIIYFTKAKGRRVPLIKWILTVLTICVIPIFLIHCSTINLVGIKQSYPDG